MSVPRLPVGVELSLPEGQAWARGSGLSGSTVPLPHYPGGSDVGANTLTEVPGASIWRNQPLRDGAAGAVPRVRPRGHCNRGRASGHAGTGFSWAFLHPRSPLPIAGAAGGSGGRVNHLHLRDRLQGPESNLEGLVRAVNRAGLAACASAQPGCAPISSESLPVPGHRLPGAGGGPSGGGLARPGPCPNPAAPRGR